MSKTKHTTHFDDCGCKSLKYEQQLSAEKEKVRKLREAGDGSGSGYGSGYGYGS